MHKCKSDRHNGYDDYATLACWRGNVTSRPTLRSGDHKLVHVWAQTINKSKGHSCSKQSQTRLVTISSWQKWCQGRVAGWKFHCKRIKTWLTWCSFIILNLIDQENVRMFKSSFPFRPKSHIFRHNPRLMFRFGSLILSVRSSGSGSRSNRCITRT